MRVPLAENSVEQRPLPTVRQNAADYTGGAQQLAELAQAAGNTGAQLGQTAQRMQDRDDADALFRTEAAVVEDYQKSFETPARDRRGHKALGLTNEAGQWWDKAGSKHGEQLTNPRQRRLFERKLSQLREQSVGSMSSFEGDQRRVSLRESTNAGIVADINLAAANPTDATALENARKGIRNKVTILGDLDGQDDVTRKGNEGEKLTALHAQVLQSLVDKSPRAAAEYLKANKAEIDGSKYAELEALVKTGTTRTIAQEAADEFAGSGLTEAEALAKARKTYSGDEEAAVIAEVKTRFTERDQARRGGQQLTADAAWKVYADGGRNKNAIPTSLWNRLDGKTKIAIEDDYRGRLSGADIKTDWAVYDQLRTMARDQPTRFAQEDLRAHYPSLGKTERETLTDIKDKLAKGEDVGTLEQQLSSVHRQMDWGAGDEEVGQFDATVRRALNAEQKDKGKPLNYEERQKVIDRMTIGAAWSSKRFYQVYGTEAEAEFKAEDGNDIDIVPDTERTKIEAALKRKGTPINDAEVLRLYRLNRSTKK